MAGMFCSVSSWKAVISLPTARISRLKLRIFPTSGRDSSSVTGALSRASTAMVGS